LRSERSYVAGLYTRLDAERARVKGQYDAALRGTGGTPMERDVQVRASAKEVKRLGIADNGLCFGRLDTLSGDHSYIGRIGLFDEENEYEPVLLDWRAPAVARVLRRHRRDTGEHASAPPIPHSRASGGRFHRRGTRPPSGWQ